MAREASGASTPPAVALGFSGSIAGTVADRDGEGTGFTSVQANAAGTQLQPAQLDLAGGRLTVTTTVGDTQGNTQQNALQTTFDGTAPYRVSATIRGPLALTHAFQGAGIFVGGGQDDHVELMAGHGSSAPRLQLAKEQGGTFTSVAAPAAPAVASAATLSLTLTVNPVTKTVVGAYSIDGGPLQTLGTTTLASLGTATDKAGIVTTHAGGGPAIQVPYDAFVVEPAAAVGNVAFQAKDVIVSSAPGLQLPTSLALGPDGRLYAAMQNGKILVFDLDADHDATHLRTISTISDRPNHGFDGITAKSVSGRQVTGIAFDPQLEGGKPVLYVSHSDPEIFKNKEPGQTTVDPASGVLTKLVLDASANVVSATDLVRGLPRSAENHGPNGMAIGPDGWLYLALGGNTNYGKQSFFFGYFPETPLSASVVRVNPDAITAPIDASRGARFSWVDPCSSGESVGDGCSAAYTLRGSRTDNGTVPGKLELYATGFRNAYDLLWHGNGHLYTNENEGNAGFGLTPGAGDEACMGTPSDPGTPPDELFDIQGGRYHGHPAPVRGECLLGGGVDPIATYGVSSSTTGIAEFTSEVFGGAMRGDILSTDYAVGDSLTRVTLGPGGGSVAQKQTLASGLSDPLDVVVHPDGTIFLAEHGGFPGTISVLRPIPSSAEGACPALGPLADSDGDEYADQDELDNATGRCNPAASPPDADGDRTSDRNDPDDDGDGTPDASDPLGLDPTNGAGTRLPFRADFDASGGGGFFGSGFHGVQPSSNGGGALEGRVGAGGAGGFLQVRSTPGTAQGSANTQHNALQQGFATNGAFTVEAAIGEPFQSGRPEAGEAGGIFLGPGEDDFVRLAVHADGGSPIVELGVEQGGTFTRHAASPALPLPASSVRLFLDGDRASGTVTARYRVGAGPVQTIATVPVPAAFLASPARAGVMTTMAGSPKADVPFVYEDFAITAATPAAAPTTAATLTAVHPGRTITTASSYTAGTFTLTNTSTGGEDIVGFTIDLAGGPAMWPDLVFDPEDGTPAGDTVSKSFTVDTGTSGGMTATGSHAAPNGDGWSVLDVATGGFDPGETLKFSIDIDPTSIRGVSGTPTPPAGGIGGAELHGATLTVRFVDGSVRTTDISITPGSVTDGRATASAARPVEPGLARAAGGSPATVSQASQTVVVSGPAGAAGVAVVAEGQMNVTGTPGGGFDLDPWEANTAVEITQVPFTIGPGGTVAVPITLTATADASAREVGLNSVTAHLVSGDVPGPVSDPVMLKLGSPPDTTAPTLTGRQPAPGAGGVGVDANVVATFSEPMNPATLTAASFHLAPSAGGAPVPAAIAASAGDTVFTLDPSADLAPGTAYTATITSAAADAAGNPLAAAQSWSITTAPAGALGTGPVTFVAGQAVIEAEDFDAKVARAGDDWAAGQSPAGSVGGALRALPDNGSGATGDVVSTAAELAYRVRFPAAGTYFLWLRVLAPDGAGNSAHAGLDGRLQVDSNSISSSTFGSWLWMAGTLDGPKATLVVPSAGEHTVHVWMREDGLNLDRLLLTTSSTSTPSGTGPAATPRAAGADTTPPTLTGRQPAPGATGVGVGANVVATFSEAMDPATLAASRFSLAPAAGVPAVAAALAASGGNTVFTLNPSADLAPGTQYTASVTTGAKDAAGNALAAAQSWSFTTAPAAPPGTGAVTFVAGQAVVEAEDHDAKVARSGKDWLSGQSPAGSVAAALKVLPDTGARVSNAIATTAPELAYRVHFPSAGTHQLWLRVYGISSGNTLYAGLDGAVTAQNMSVQTGAWRWVKTGVAVPSPGEHTVHAWMREDGLSIDRLLLTTSTSFTPTGTGPAATPRQAAGDTIPPTLTARQPAPGATGVAPGANVVATFSEAMDPATLTAASFSLAPTAGGPAVAASVAASAGNTVFTLDPGADLALGTQYTATVTSGAKDGAGNALAATQAWSFTTVSPDTAPPTVTGRQPPPGATGVAAAASVVATFSEAMDPATLTGATFSLAPTAGGPAVAASVAASAGNTVFTLDPGADLALGTQYTATVTSGARDAAGNALAAPESWSFTTVAADTTPPTVTVRQPSPGATGIARGTDVVATFSEAMNPATLTGASFTLAPSAGGTAVAATIAASAGSTVFTLNPSADLTPGTRYTATITTAARDAAGNALAAPEGWSFTTSAVAPSTVTEITTGEILGAPFDRRKFYVRRAGGPWELTHPGGLAAARGTLMNFRAANAIFDDEARADDDPAANTAEFVSHFAEYRARGILAYTVSLQGGFPGYEGAIATAFNADGTLKQAWLDRAAQVIEAADDHGQVVILTYFYQRQDQRLTNDAAVRAAVRNATDWLIAQGYRNVIIEIANEYDSPLHDQPLIKQNLATGGVAELITLAKSRFDGLGYRQPVSVSARDLDFSGPLREASDLALIHGNLSTPADDGAATAALVADATVHGPVVMNEDFNGFDATQANLNDDKQTATNVFNAGGSWGLMWQRYNQDYPFQWALGPSTDIGGGSRANYFRAILDHVGGLVGEDLPPAVVSRQPAPGATEVAPGAPVAVTFSRAMDPATITAASFTVTPAGGSPVAATIAASAGNTVFTLNPAADLQPDSDHTVTITTAAQAADGTPLGAPAAWTFRTGDGSAPGPVTFVSGVAAVEAEDMDQRIARAGRDWVPGTAPAGAVGQAVQAAPDTGVTVTESVATGSPQLGFRVLFPSAGTYYMWFRVNALDGAGNSFFAGLNGATGPSYLSSGTFGSWVWLGGLFGGGRATVTVPSAGEHVVQVWMREDGLRLDRVVLSTTSGFTPTGTGPAATPRT